MGRITVHAGDFIKGKVHSFGFRAFTLKTDVFQWVGETIQADKLESIEVASEENVKKMGSAAAWGVAGALALGPVGLLAGVLAGGNKKEKTFIAEFKDGRRMLATTDSKTFTQIQAALFQPGAPAPVSAVPQTANAEVPSHVPEHIEVGDSVAPEKGDHFKPLFQALAVLAISFGLIGIAVAMGGRSETSSASQSRSSEDNGILGAISGSDDFEAHKDIFLKGANTLLDHGNCSLSALKDVGGWVRSSGDPSGLTYFTYCGKPAIENRWYITLPSGRVYQNPYR